MPCLATTSSDPNSKNGMMTKVWGPAGWLFLHCVTFGYPENPDLYDIENGLAPGTTRSRYKRFFMEIGNILPCKYCRESYKDFIKVDAIDINLKNRSSLIEWLWRIHNKINLKLVLNYCDATITNIKNRYETFRAKCNALSPSEIKLNSEKGCITPADGIPKKCKIEIIKTDKGGITRRITQSNISHNLKFFLNDKIIIVSLSLIILILVIYIVYYLSRQ